VQPVTREVASGDADVDEVAVVVPDRGDAGADTWRRVDLVEI
jgi:hypothetical protein